MVLGLCVSVTILAATYLVTPCACAGGKAIGFVCHLSVVVIVVITTKIARSGDLGI